MTSWAILSTLSCTALKKCGSPCISQMQISRSRAIAYGDKKVESQS
jgi:hypothetical protein